MTFSFQLATLSQNPLRPPGQTVECPHCVCSTFCGSSLIFGQLHVKATERNIKTSFCSVWSCVSRTCEQRVSVLLVVYGVKGVVPSRLEDGVEELAALLAVLHRVLTFHQQQQGNQVGHSDRSVN